MDSVKGGPPKIIEVIECGSSKYSKAIFHICLKKAQKTREGSDNKLGENMPGEGVPGPKK